ncbi:hypothetical protein ACP4OV_029462 [Aristida adscensionis]
MYMNHLFYNFRDSDEHRRCIAACLVQGTYVMEIDQTRPRVHAALAPPWWESFHYRLLKVLECECECMLCRTSLLRVGANRHRPWFIYGAILEHAPPAGERRHPSAPRYIAAFRGTMPRHPTLLADMHHNLKILVNRQHDCCRFRHARREVGELLDYYSAVAGGGDGGVWLAGHSLGASIALDVGRDMMAGRGLGLPTFLFNPPQVSLAPGMLPAALSRVARGVVYPASYVVKAAMGTTVLRSHERGMEELFERLAPWAPELYAHERDVICRGFIDYFEQRQRMLDRARFRPVAEVAMKLSFRDMHVSVLDRADGKEQRVRPHLLPSARLWKSSAGGDAHGLEQWWQPDSRLNLSSRRYSCA